MAQDTALDLILFLVAVDLYLVMHGGNTATEIEGWGKPGKYRLWEYILGSSNRCGLNGNDCRPFSGSALASRCPANCAGQWVLESGGRQW